MHMDKILANYNYCCLLLVARRLLLRNVKSLYPRRGLNLFVSRS